ncbi:uncharacterized protein LOC127796622 isoform X1 [Diospyros lotus]|uniref:uncharacterized protein LOC127796622 isoform X1 n=1 Tax=Diospyros lotus TaxID=55363 RepID=UPI002258E720|nr:uncharacterized protein LOC127796622 isoform X1 [Diospyros lotus]
MEDEVVSDGSFSFPISEPKLKLGDKRSNAEFVEYSKLRCKRVKTRDLESLFHSRENLEGDRHFLPAEKKKPQSFKGTARAKSVKSVPTPLDFIAKVCAASNSVDDDSLHSAKKLPSLKKHEIEQEVNFGTSRGFALDMNSENVSSSQNQEPLCPHKNRGYLKLGDASECGTTTSPLKEKDTMRVWKEMKQNGFLSSSYGAIPVPRPSRRKTKSDTKNMELAKRVQVDKFVRIAAPTGLLNELNPGIINHVRNMKQVHSIIEALVKSEKLENHPAGHEQAIPKKSATKSKSIIDRRKDLKNENGLGMRRLSLSGEDGSLSSSLGSQQKRGCPMLLSESVYLNSYHKGGDGESSNLERTFGKTTCGSFPMQESEDDILKLKLSPSTTTASDNISSLSSEESANLTSVSALSFKAANIASQWLELICQDIKGRLTALGLSKKRVRAVISTEMPFLMSREFSSNQENDQPAIKNPAAGCHVARWSALFHQMEKALSEEEKQLENWLSKVKEMRLHCNQGLQHFCNPLHGLKWMGTLEDNSTLQELAVRAAAASIYSTCNFVLSTQSI